MNETGVKVSPGAQGGLGEDGDRFSVHRNQVLEPVLSRAGLGERVCPGGLLERRIGSTGGVTCRRVQRLHY